MNCLKHSDFFGSNLSEIEKFLFESRRGILCSKGRNGFKVSPCRKLSVPLVLSFNHVSFKMSALSQRLQFGASLISRPNGH